MVSSEAITKSAEDTYEEQLIGQCSWPILEEALMKF